MKKLNRTLNSIMAASAAISVTRIAVDYIDYKFWRPEVYLMYSAPWYTSGLIYFAVTILVILICCTVKLILKLNNKKTSH